LRNVHPLSGRNRRCSPSGLVAVASGSVDSHRNCLHIGSNRRVVDQRCYQVDRVCSNDDILSSSERWCLRRQTECKSVSDSSLCCNGSSPCDICKARYCRASIRVAQSVQTSTAKSIQTLCKFNCIKGFRKFDSKCLTVDNSLASKTWVGGRS